MQSFIKNNFNKFLIRFFKKQIEKKNNIIDKPPSYHFFPLILQN